MLQLFILLNLFDTWIYYKFCESVKIDFHISYNIPDLQTEISINFLP